MAVLASLGPWNSVLLRPAGLAGGVGVRAKLVLTEAFTRSELPGSPLPFEDGQSFLTVSGGPTAYLLGIESPKGKEKSKHPS